MRREKQIEEMTCEKCLHYEMCLEKFRNAKKDGFYEFVDEEEYFSHADECDFFVTGYRKRSEGEWISVRERLPLNFESVLVLATSRREDDGYDVLIAYHDRGEWEERCVHGDGNTVYAHVKYWMPLPEPPKAKKPKAKQPKDSENYEKKRLLAGDCFHGEIWCRCPYCLTSIEAHSIPKDRICHKCGKEYL